MSEYRVEYDQDYQFENDHQDALEHYRIQITKLEDKLREEAITYKKRIAELEGELYANRKPMVNQSQKKNAPKLQENLSYQLYEKDLQIRQLKAENVKLRQIINNPDKVLIRKPDHFQAITQKEQEILKLRRTIQELEGKHDGQFLSQQKLKKENEMLQHQIQELRKQIRNGGKFKFGLNDQKIDPELLSALKMKKELQASQKEIIVLQNALKGKDQELLVWRTKYANSRNVGLGAGTQIEELKLELTQFRDKNRDLNKVVLKLQEENQRLYSQRDKARFAAQQRLPEVARKVQNESQRTENLMRYHQSRSIAMKSLVPPAEEHKTPITMRKTARYDQFHFSDWESVA